MVFKTISMFWTAVYFFFTCHAWFKLWTVNLHSSLQGNKLITKSWWEIQVIEGSSCQG